MPFGRKYRPRKGKKVTKKRRFPKKASTTISRAPASSLTANSTRFPGFPPTTRANLRYVTTVDIANGYTQALYKFRANGCADPDFTGDGHRPIGWDNWVTFYNHYVVVGSKLTVTVSAGNANNNSDAVCFFNTLADDDVVPSDLSALLEQGKVKYRILPGNMQTQRPVYIKQYYSPKRFFNITDIKDNLTRIGAATSADPAEAAMFVIGKQGVMPSGDYGGSFQMICQIDYIVEFSEPKQLAQSIIP